MPGPNVDSPSGGPRGLSRLPIAWLLSSKDGPVRCAIGAPICGPFTPEWFDGSTLAYWQTSMQIEGGGKERISNRPRRKGNW
jgi:hypothetical protein